MELKDLKFEVASDVISLKKIEEPTIDIYDEKQNAKLAKAFIALGKTPEEKKTNAKKRGQSRVI